MAPDYPMNSPIAFSFRDLIAGNGFVACVSVRGRAVYAVEADGAQWLYGVQPGGIAGGDEKVGPPFGDFKDSYLSVLYDIAAEAATYAEFSAKVTEFLSAINQPCATDWDMALIDLRAREASGEKVSSKLMRVLREEVKTDFFIGRILPEGSSHQLNQFDTYVLAF